MPLAQLRPGLVGRADGRRRADVRRGHRRADRHGLVRRASTWPAVLAYGRGVGGPALRELTFHQRAARPQGARPATCASTATSCTRCPPAPAPRSVDSQVRRRRRHRRAAGLRVSKGKRELPADTVHRRGPGRAARPGRPVRRPAHPHPAARRGRADQRLQLPGVGAAGEVRARPSSPACPPSIKPATPTAYLTARLVELIVESGLLPDGALQLRLRQRRRPARPPHRAGPASRSPARRPPRSGCAPTRRSSARVGAVQRRGRLAELLDPRPGRRARARRSSTSTSSSSSPR